MSPRKRRKSEIIDEVRSLIIEVRGSQTSSRKEELQHHRKRRKCGKVGRHRGLRSSHTGEGESLTHREEQVWHHEERKESGITEIPWIWTSQR